MNRLVVLAGVVLLMNGSIQADVRKAWIGVNGLT